MFMDRDKSEAQRAGSLQEVSGQLRYVGEDHYHYYESKRATLGGSARARNENLSRGRPRPP